MGRLTIKEPLDPLPGWDASLLCGHSERCLPEGFVIKGKRWRPRQTIQPALVSSVQGTFSSVMVASWWFLVRISPSLYPSLCHHLILLCYRSLRKISITWVHHVILRPCLYHASSCRLALALRFSENARLKLSYHCQAYKLVRSLWGKWNKIS